MLAAFLLTPRFGNSTGLTQTYDAASPFSNRTVTGEEARTFIERALVGKDIANVRRGKVLEISMAKIYHINQPSGVTIEYASIPYQDQTGSLLYAERYRDGSLFLTDAAVIESPDGPGRIMMVSVAGSIMRTSSGELVQSGDGCTQGGCAWKPATWCKYCDGGRNIQSVSGYKCCCTTGYCIADLPVNYGPCGAC